MRYNNGARCKYYFKLGGKYAPKFLYL